MGNLQYIVNRLSARGAGLPIVVLRLRLLRQYLFQPNRLLWTMLFHRRLVFSLTPIHLSLSLRSPRVIAAIVAGVSAGIGVSVYVLTRKKPTPEEIERERRELLARSGRITDGTIMDTMVTEAQNAAEVPAGDDDSTPTPQIILYNYRIAGVTYECAQDVTALAAYVHGIRTDLPVQVRYLPQNPANSIVVAESWSGLRLSSSAPYQGD